MTTLRQRQTIAAALANGTEPSLNKDSEILSLKAGNARVIIERRGEITRAGQFYYREANQTASRRTQPPIDWATTSVEQRGNRRYAIRNGKKVLVMSFNPVTGEGS